MRLVVTRTLLLLGGLSNLLLALSIPAPWHATLAQLTHQVVFVLSASLCAIAFVQLRRAPAAGRRWTLGVGALSLLLLLGNGKLLFLMLLDGGKAQALSALLPLATWISLIVAGAWASWRPKSTRPTPG